MRSSSSPADRHRLLQLRDNATTASVLLHAFLQRKRQDHVAELAKLVAIELARRLTGLTQCVIGEHDGGASVAVNAVARKIRNGTYSLTQASEQSASQLPAAV